MQYSWLTDIHLNFVDEVARQQFYQKIIDTLCDGVLINGDIAEALCFSGVSLGGFLWLIPGGDQYTEKGV